VASFSSFEFTGPTSFKLFYILRTIGFVIKSTTAWWYGELASTIFGPQVFIFCLK